MRRWSPNCGGRAPIPTNDIWIAAVALENGGRVVASDDHFTRVP